MQYDNFRLNFCFNYEMVFQNKTTSYNVFIAYLSLATSDFHMYLWLFQTQYIENSKESLAVRYMPHIELDKVQDTRTSASLFMRSCKDLKIEKKIINVTHLDFYEFIIWSPPFNWLQNFSQWTEFSITFKFILKKINLSLMKQTCKTIVKIMMMMIVITATYHVPSTVISI